MALLFHNTVFTGCMQKSKRCHLYFAVPLFCLTGIMKKNAGKINIPQCSQVKKTPANDATEQGRHSTVFVYCVAQGVKKRNIQQTNRSVPAHLLSRQMIHSADAEDWAEVCAATIFGEIMDPVQLEPDLHHPCFIMDSPLVSLGKRSRLVQLQPANVSKPRGMTINNGDISSSSWVSLTVAGEIAHTINETYSYDEFSTICPFHMI